MEGKRVHEVALGGAEVHIFFVAIGKKEIITLPALGQCRQMSGVELQLDFITATEHNKAVIRIDQQIADVSESCISANRASVRSGGAYLVVDEFELAGRLIFAHPRVAMKRKPRLCERHIHYFGCLSLLRSRIYKDLIPVNLQIGSNAEPGGSRREPSPEVGHCWSRQPRREGP